MVRLKTGLVLLLLPMLVWGKVKVYPQDVVLGEPVTWVFTGQDIEKDFKKFDKAEIKRSFEIYDVDGNADRVRMTLYPRRVGVLHLPKIQQGQINFEGAAIRVADNPDVQIDWQADKTTTLFVNQPYFWRAHVHLNHPEFAVTLEAHPHAKAALRMAFEPKPFAVEEHLLSQTRNFVMSFWGEQVGEFSARSPVIRVKNSSQKTWLFFDETQTLNIRALPTYLPYQLALGTLSIDAQPLAFFNTIGALNQWELTLTSQNVEPTFLPSVPQQVMIANPQSNVFEWLSPSVTQTQTWSDNGWQIQQNWSLPFRINHFGFYELPSVRLTYFDVASQQLKDAWLPSKMGFALPSGVFMVAKLLGLILLLGGLMVLSVFVYRYGLKRWLISRVHQANSVEEIWRAIVVFQTRFTEAEQELNLKSPLFSTESIGIILTMKADKENKVSHETLLLAEQFNQAFYAPHQVKNIDVIKPLAEVWARQQSLRYSDWRAFWIIRYFFKAIHKA